MAACDGSIALISANGLCCRMKCGVLCGSGAQGGVHFQQACIALKMSGKPMPVLEWQARQGFPGVSDAVLRKIYAMLSLDLPERADADDSDEISLSLGLIEHVLPNVTPEQIKEAFSQKAKVEHHASQVAQVLFDQFLSDDLLEDCTSLSDKRLTHSVLRECKTASERSQKTREKVQSYLAEAKPKKKQKVVASPSFPSVKESSSRWWATIPGDAAFIEKHRPPLGNCHVDNDNGRYRLSYPGFGLRSISWMRRGEKRTALEVLQLWWQWHNEATGDPVPPEVTDATAA